MYIDLILQMVELRYVRMSKTSPCTPMSVSNSVFRVGGTQWMVLSAAATQNRVKITLMGVQGDVYSKLQRERPRRRHIIGGIYSVGAP